MFLGDLPDLHLDPPPAERRIENQTRLFRLRSSQREKPVVRPRAGRAREPPLPFSELWIERLPAKMCAHDGDANTGPPVEHLFIARGRPQKRRIGKRRTDQGNSKRQTICSKSGGEGNCREI